MQCDWILLNDASILPQYIQENREIWKLDRCDGNVRPKVTSGKCEHLRTGDPVEMLAANRRLPFQCPGFRPLISGKVSLKVQLFYLGYYEIILFSHTHEHLPCTDWLKETKSWLGTSNTPRCENRTLIFVISYFLDKNFNLELTTYFIWWWSCCCCWWRCRCCCCVQGYLIDVGTADDGVDVVNNHHLGVDIDGGSERLPEDLSKGFGGFFQSVKMWSGCLTFPRAHKQLRNRLINLIMLLNVRLQIKYRVSEILTWSLIFKFII